MPYHNAPIHVGTLQKSLSMPTNWSGTQISARPARTRGETAWYEESIYDRIYCTSISCRDQSYVTLAYMITSVNCAKCTGLDYWGLSQAVLRLWIIVS